jgi:hypothetical protein
MIDYFAKRGDTLAPLEAALTNCDGTPVDLTGATVEFLMRSATPGATAPLDLDATITVLPVEPPATVPNRVRVAWGAGDLDTPGRYYADWQVTWGAATLTLPTVGHLQLHVLDDIA